MTEEKKIYVVKRSGAREPLDLEKIHKVLFWACDGMPGVSVSDIEIQAKLQLVDGVLTKDIHEILIRAASDLLSEEFPDYQYVASRLLNMALRKDVFGKGLSMPPLAQVLDEGIHFGVYDPEIRSDYSPEELRTFDGWLDHDRDYRIPYAGLRQVIDKYLVQDRVTGRIYETPQYAYMLIGMTAFRKYGKAERLPTIHRFYDAVSQFKLSLPTPVIAGVRTPVRQYASCVGIDIADNLDSIFASNHALGRLTAQRAGMGVNFGRVRSKGSKVRGGEVVHTGLLPFMKIVAATVKSCTQNGIRGGSATCHVPIWHPEIEDVIVLKNNKGTEDNRIRTLDYSIQLWSGFWDRCRTDDDLCLFDPHESEELYNAWGTMAFEEKYREECAKPEKIRKRVNARDLCRRLFAERLGTGRIYLMDMDNANRHSAFDIPVRFSNLCQEINLPAEPIYSVNGDEGEIFTCILSAVNVAECGLGELREVTDLAVRFLDELIDHMEYPVPAAGRFSRDRRALGVGIIGLADLLAREKVHYSDPGAPWLVHTYAEEFALGLTRASVELAKVKGPCKKFGDTKYSRGVLPIDTYAKAVDDIVKTESSPEWETLRKDILRYGMRNSTLMAFMPAESSAVVSGSSNGIEPLRALVTTKNSKKGPIKSVAKYIATHAKDYQLCWDRDYTNDGYLKVAAVWQKFADQGMSLNLYSDPRRYPDGLVSLGDTIADAKTAFRYGHKELYYQNTLDLSGEEQIFVDGAKSAGAEGAVPVHTDTEACGSGACAI
jgi:ribonucleoside-diphosphate reductase alpha chain